MTSITFPRPTIKDEDILLYYNGPQLLIANVMDELRVLMFAVELHTDEYLVLDITQEQEKRFRDCQITARALVLEVKERWGVYRLEDLYASEWELTMLENIPKQWLPGDVFLRPNPP